MHKFTGFDFQRVYRIRNDAQLIAFSFLWEVDSGDNSLIFTFQWFVENFPVWVQTQ